MDNTRLMAVVAQALDSVGVPYVVTGSMASSAFGEPRLTLDVDIIVDLKPEQVPALHACFPDSEYYFSDEAAHDAIRGGHSFNIIHPASGLKADIIVAGRDPVSRARVKRCRELMTTVGVRVKFSAPEDVILSKLQFYRQGGSDKHLRDITGILKTGREPLNLEYITALAEQWGVGDVWRACQEAARRADPKP